MANCGCNEGPCTCLFSSGPGVQITGNGSRRQPYRPSVDPYELFGSLGNVDVTITGTGTSGDPWVVQMDVTQDSAVTEIIYSADDTWIKPEDILFVSVEVIGGGASGAEAPPQVSGTDDPHGPPGGDGGQRSTMLIPASLVPDEVDVTVGLGAVISGNSGGASYFGDILGAAGGVGRTMWVRADDEPSTLDPLLAVGTRPNGGPGGYASYAAFSAEVVSDRLVPPGGGRGQYAVLTPGTGDTPSTPGGVCLLGGYPGWQGGDGGTIDPEVPGGDGVGPGAGGGGGGVEYSATGSNTNDQSAPGSGADGLVRVRMW